MLSPRFFNNKIIQISVGNLTGRQCHLLANLQPVKAGKPAQLLVVTTRSLVQSSRKDQKVTNKRNQQHQLIPIARNISFRQCRQSEVRALLDGNFMFNNVGAPHSTSATLDQNLLGDLELESPIELVKRKSKHFVDTRSSGRVETAPPTNYYGQIFNETLSQTDNERRLVVLLSWLEAKEKHIEKYRQFYLDRGFDVLNVKTSPLDLLNPSRGAMKIATDFVRFMVEKQYSNVVLHGFSVGGYMFGQFLLEIDKQTEAVKRELLGSIQGVVFDSVVPFEGTCVGVANSVTENRLAAKVIENLLRLYLVVGHNVATKYYLEASEKVWNGPLRCPTLFLMSRDDRISDHRIVLQLADTWAKLGVQTYRRLFDSSPHVQLFQRHHDAYVNEVETFLKSIKLQ